MTVPWGHHPFLCRNCRNFYAEPLSSRESSYGMIQTGTFTRDGHDLQGWWLYDWENPEPDMEIAAIEVSAVGQTALALAAVTLCHEQRDPFAWPARQEVALRVDAEGTPEVAMARGEVVRQDQLFVPGDDFLTSEESGWGRGGQEVVDGGYLEIHGSPEGQVEIEAGEVRGSIRWGQVLAEKKVEQGGVRIEVVGPRGDALAAVARAGVEGLFADVFGGVDATPGGWEQVPHRRRVAKIPHVGVTFPGRGESPTRPGKGSAIPSTPSACRSCVLDASSLQDGFPNVPGWLRG